MAPVFQELVRGYGELSHEEVTLDLFARSNPGVGGSASCFGVSNAIHIEGKQGPITTDSIKINPLLLRVPQTNTKACSVTGVVDEKTEDLRKAPLPLGDLFQSTVTSPEFSKIMVQEPTQFTIFGTLGGPKGLTPSYEVKVTDPLFFQQLRLANQAIKKGKTCVLGGVEKPDGSVVLHHEPICTPKQVPQSLPHPSGEII
jgi:hypothetical protein